MNKSIFNVVGVVAVAAVFSIGCSEKPDDEGGGGGGKGSDISKYKTVTIGSQKWMAENLDNAVAGSVCYDKDPANCEKYGRLYNWAAAKKACPAGWRLPSADDWNNLMDYVGGESTAATKLRAASGWGEYLNGTDEYEFSALPGGTGMANGLFGRIGGYGYWWSATEDEDGDALFLRMDHQESAQIYGLDKTDLCSVRCVQD
jgi:uncharacterized protein (TIGR02145 family)